MRTLVGEGIGAFIVVERTLVGEDIGAFIVVEH